MKKLRAINPFTVEHIELAYMQERVKCDRCGGRFHQLNLAVRRKRPHAARQYYHLSCFETQLMEEDHAGSADRQTEGQPV
jgi:hypothetical protein